jgi:hypothetical protein
MTNDGRVPLPAEYVDQNICIRIRYARTMVQALTAATPHDVEEDIPPLERVACFRGYGQWVPANY